MKVNEIRNLLRQLSVGSDKITYEAKKAFVENYQEPLLKGQRLPNGEVVKTISEEWSIRGLWEALVGPVDETLPIDRYFSETTHRQYFEAALDSTMFPKAMGNLMINKVIEGYSSPMFIGDQLVENMPSNLKSETIVGFTGSQGLKEVAEGGQYEESSISEKYVTTETSKKGRIISLTEEDIRFDRTGQILMRARMLGEEAGRDKEETILRGVTGVNTKVYKPNGTAKSLYSSGHKNLKESNGLTDWTQIDAALLQHVEIKDNRQGGKGKPVMWMPSIILTGPANATTAKRIVGATEIRSHDGSASKNPSDGNTVVSANPFGNFTVLSSSLWPAASTDWFIGDFRRQFIWQEIWPIRVFSQGANAESAFEADVISRFKVSYYGGIAAVDHRYVIKNTA